MGYSAASGSGGRPSWDGLAAAAVTLAYELGPSGNPFGMLQTLDRPMST